MQVNEILETCIYVNDLRAAESFYRDVLGLEQIGQQEGRHVFFRCGRQMFLVFDPAASSSTAGELPPHGAVGSVHVAFAVPADSLTAWRVQLESNGVEIEKTVEWPSGGRSLYFRDPAGNSLELATPGIWGIDDDAILSD